MAPGDMMMEPGLVTGDDSPHQLDFVLSLVSDAARANKKLARWLGSNLPANSLLSWHHCNAHEVNHTVEPVWRGLHINELFCSAKVLHAGNTFFDLITHVANEILENMEVVYGQNPQSSADQL